jgi:hypothetical protein
MSGMGTRRSLRALVLALAVVAGGCGSSFGEEARGAGGSAAQGGAGPGSGVAAGGAAAGGAAAGGAGGGGLLDDYPPALLTAASVKPLTAASAALAFTHGALVRLGPQPDPLAPGCPSVTTLGDETVYSGDGCTLADGSTLHGKAVITVIATDVRSVAYDQYGVAKQCPDPGNIEVSRTTGTMTYTRAAPGAGSFVLAIELGRANCAGERSRLAYDYQGSVAGTETAAWEIDPNALMIFNGSGRVGLSTVGAADAVTVRQIVDRPSCGPEVTSGTTTLSSLGDTAVITYDGANDCDETSTVRWTLNGADQGELAGVGCALAGVPSGAPRWLALGVVALLTARRFGRAPRVAGGLAQSGSRRPSS